MGETKLVTSVIFFLLFLHGCCCSNRAPTKVKAGYWLSASVFPIAEMEATLFTHLIYGFATINSSTFSLSVPPSEQQYLSSFSNTIKQHNPLATTLLSIGDIRIAPILMSMLPSSTYRKAFVNSTTHMARAYGFDGIDLVCFYRHPLLANITATMADHLGTLFDEWRAAVDSESQRLNKTRLILTMAVYYKPSDDYHFPMGSIQRNFDWVNVVTFDYFSPTTQPSRTHFHAALYDPFSDVSTDFGIKKWIKSGFSKDKIVLGLPFHGYAWLLSDPSKNNSLGAPASGLAFGGDGSISYRYIKPYAQSGGLVVYNSTYVESYCTSGSLWMCYNDVMSIKTKVAYAMEIGLLGYFVFQVPNDDNWVLSRAASDQMDGKDQGKKRPALIMALVFVAVFVLLLLLIFYFRVRLLRYIRGKRKCSKSFSSDSIDLKMFSYEDIKAATNNFCYENKLGEGGYGPVFKGKLSEGDEIAVKRLSKTSKQGYQEFKNEVTLAARLQHVNLVKVIGFCMERDEKMLIYEYLPNKSLDLHLFNPSKKHVLDWDRRVEIIDGIIQGLVYLQEYSRLTIIHKDLKASNILLDKEFQPKISDFGLARIFQKDEYEANTDRIVGTYGYVPPEYVKKGVYSMKYDVFSFGVLLLQIISGKRNNCFYGVNENLSLLEYAYELWKDGRAMEFIDPVLGDSSSKCKLERCIHTALLCVQKRPEDRPMMLEVSLMLKNENAQMVTPKRPAFSINRDEGVGCVAMCSSNTCTFSDVDPR